MDATATPKKISTSGDRMSRREEWRVSKGMPIRGERKGKNRQGREKGELEGRGIRWIRIVGRSTRTFRHPIIPTGNSTFRSPQNQLNHSTRPLLHQYYPLRIAINRHRHLPHACTDHIDLPHLDARPSSTSCCITQPLPLGTPLDFPVGSSFHCCCVISCHLGF